MKLPAKIIICGSEWDIIKVDTQTGGSYNTLDHKIFVGTKSNALVLNNFLHEVIEAIFAERYLRYGIFQETNDKVLFCMTHTEFDCAIADIAIALKDVLKPNVGQ